MDDNKTLLELAAKALGLKTNGFYNEFWGIGVERDLRRANQFEGRMDCWNPLNSNNDVFELGVKLGIRARLEENAPPELSLGLPRRCAIAVYGLKNFIAVDPRDFESDIAAVRCAIVRAAAEIGRNL